MLTKSVPDQDSAVPSSLQYVVLEIFISAYFRSLLRCIVFMTSDTNSSNDR